MNRYLVVPLVLSCLLFVGVLCSKASVGKSATAYSTQEPTLTEQDEQQEQEESELLSLDEIRTLVLDGWPTVPRSAWASRAGPRISSYAELTGGRGAVELGNDTSFLTSLTVLENGNRVYFPLHVDRVSGEVMIFAGRRGNWMVYTNWRDGYLPKYLKRTQSDAAKGSSRRE